jgi:hypothetical protein
MTLPFRPHGVDGFNGWIDLAGWRWARPAAGWRLRFVLRNAFALLRGPAKPGLAMSCGRGNAARSLAFESTRHGPLEPPAGLEPATGCLRNSCCFLLS